MNLDLTMSYKVTHQLWYRGRNEGIFKTDLQYDDGQWCLVMEWTTNHDGEYPSVRHPIDTGLLRPLGDDFLIEGPVEIPENPALTTLLAQLKGLR